MVSTPAVTPITVPETDPPIEVWPLLALHVPPGGVATIIVLAPAHTVGAPKIIEGEGFTVIVFVKKQVGIE